MSLAPPWAKAAAILGLKMQLDQLRIAGNALPDGIAKDFLKVTLDSYEAEIGRIEAMKN